MKIQANGQERELSNGKLLGEFLEENQYQQERIAVELNGDIVPKSRYGETVLAGGGCAGSGKLCRRRLRWKIQ